GSGDRRPRQSGARAHFARAHYRIKGSLVPPPYRHHVFICTNRRPEGNPKGSCAAKGSEAVKDRFKEELHARGLKGEVRANAAGCLDACERGISVVVFSSGQAPVWYQKVTEADVGEIVERHLVGGQVVERLRME